MRLVIVAYAIAPGPGGPEGHVNARMLEALATVGWPDGVSVITAGAAPQLPDGRAVSELPGWAFHGLGECGEHAGKSSAWSRLALRYRRGADNGRGPGWLMAKLVNRCCAWHCGYALKLNAWERSARLVLAAELQRWPDAVVYSRALPFSSIAAAGLVRRRRRFPWIVNINDPMPADVWPGLYASDARSDRVIRRRWSAILPEIDAITFPSARLRDLEVQAFPALASRPCAILPHITCQSPAGVANNIVSAATTPGPRKLRIAFAGTLRKSRISPAFAKALTQAVGASPRLRGEVELTFHLARPNQFADEFIKTISLPTRVVHGLENEDLDAALREADVILDLEAPEDKPLLLTKVANAVGLERPLWALCAPSGTTWALVHQHAWGYASDLADSAAVQSTFQQILADWTANRLDARKPSPELRTRFSGQEQVCRLRELCTCIASHSTGTSEPLPHGPSSADWP